jgi:hypothetical protein
VVALGGGAVSYERGTPVYEGYQGVVGGALEGRHEPRDIMALTV